MKVGAISDHGAKCLLRGTIADHCQKKMSFAMCWAKWGGAGKDMKFWNHHLLYSNDICWAFHKREYFSPSLAWSGFLFFPFLFCFVLLWRHIIKSDNIVAYGEELLRCCLNYLSVNSLAPKSKHLKGPNNKERNAYNEKGGGRLREVYSTKAFASISCKIKGTLFKSHVLFCLSVHYHITLLLYASL